MNSLSPELNRQGIDYGEKANVQDLHADIAREHGSSPVTIRPFSLSTLIVCGLTFFFAAFFLTRCGMDSSALRATQESTPSAPVSGTLRADANSANTAASAVQDAPASAVVHVVMRNMKFDPATVEVKSGDVVEWKNEDITPHTATSTSFDSASIDPDKSWKHTFSEPGNFPYNCTFHPNMKAVVTVK